MSISIKIPRSEQTDISKLIFGLGGSNNRPLVFFDETINGYIIYKDGKKPRTRRSTAYLEAFIMPDEVEELIKNNLLAEKVSSYSILDMTLDETNIVFDGVSDVDANYYIVWKFEFPVTYPKKKFTNPKLYVTCLLHDNDDESVVERPVSPQQHILANYEPAERTNLFSELNNEIKQKSPHKFELSSAIVEKVPVPSTEEDQSDDNEADATTIITKTTLRATISIPVSVSLVIRLKSTKPAGRNNILLATLNIESSDEINDIIKQDDWYFEIISLDMEFKYGSISEFSCSQAYPIRFRSNDSINLTYKLVNNEFLDKEIRNEYNYQFTRPIGIKLVLRVQKNLAEIESFENFSNTITTSWTPLLDFGIIAPPINNLLKTPTNYSQSQSQPNIPLKANPRKSAMMNNLYKIKSPNGVLTTPNSTGALSTMSGANSVKKKSVIGSTTSSVTVNLTSSSNSSLSGLKLTFMGKLSIRLGEILRWKVQAINNSNNRLNLSLLVQSPASLVPANNTAMVHNMSSSNFLSTEDGTQEEDVIIYSRPQLYAAYNASKLNTNGVIVLNNDIRIGPMEVNTVFETEIRLIGISKGIYNLDGIKIFDINSGDGLDFGKLVEVFVV